MSSDKESTIKSPEWAWSKYGPAKAVAIAVALGMMMGLGVGLVFMSETSANFGLYLIALAFNVALAAGFTEYLVEWYFFPGMKKVTFLTIIGALAMFGGQAVRSVAMNTAGRNFSHLVAEEKKQSHQLVTSGIYAFARHPSYFGWFVWSIATQIVLCNPICALAYIKVSWEFFSDRIEYEEEYLVEFFGEDYRNYRRNVWSGIPFIK
eukprot:gene16715-19869_t